MEEILQTGAEVQTESKELELYLPSGLAQVKDLFGQPGMSYCQAGKVNLPSETSGTTVVRCHEKVEHIFQKFVDEIEKAGYWNLVQTISGYKYKVRQGASIMKENKMSLAAYGLSLELNHAYNPFNMLMRTKPTGEPAKETSQGRPGYAFYSDHPIVQIAKKCGLVWAGVNGFRRGVDWIKHSPTPCEFRYCKEW